MTTLTRCRNNDPHCEGWRIFYGDVQVGTIAKSAGMPLESKQWNWSCGFYPGVEPGQQRSGSAASYEKARAAFERAWRQLLPQLTPESFEVHRRHLTFERWKYRMWKEGFKLPTQLASGRLECLCGMPIDIDGFRQHFNEHHMSERKL
jgi:hypothetical protein